jgi:alpha-methylacyl-CoA racemase
VGLLDGVTVLDLASVGPAARASAWLADYGAAIVKVAPAPASAAVQIVPSAHAYSGGRGTRRVRLDLKADAGRETFLRMTEHADVVIESFRPGVVDRLGVGYDDVKSRNPRIVYCATTGYGQRGPRAQWAGHDIDYLAVGGFLGNAEPAAGGRPPIPGATVADSAGGGMHAVIAILAALVSRASTGEGSYLDVAVADGVLSLMSLQVDAYLATGAAGEPGTAPLHGRFACYDTYRAADGGWLAVGAIEAKFWANLCRALGCTQWIDAQYDEHRQEAVRADIAAAFVTRTRDEWVAELSPADTCVAPVLSIVEAATDSALADRGGVATARHPGAGEFRQLAPLLAGAQRAAVYDIPDQSVTEPDAVLGAMGFTGQEVAELKTSGVLA